MYLQFDAEQIEELMRSFYILSKIRFVLFDSNFKEIISYPKENCTFCKMMKKCPQTRRRCNYADRRAFEKCEKENQLVIYKCHAGLVEAAMPLHDNEKIIGYLMFGQITDSTDKTALSNKVDGWVQKYGLDSENLKHGIDNISYIPEEQIKSAAKIMEACTSYIIYKELITPDNDKFLEAAKNYIETHLGDDIEIETLCSELHIGRTKLYKIFRSELKMGISKYILTRRLHNAKKLLKSSELPIPEIANRVGFSDYNYFSRVYKKRYGKSPKHYR